MSVAAEFAFCYTAIQKRGLTHGAIDQTAPEVDIGRQPALDEEVIFQRSIVQSHGCVQQFILASPVIRYAKGVSA